MKNEQEIINELNYYKSGIRQLYVKNYQYYLFLLLAVMIITVVGVATAPLVIRLIFIVVLIAEFYMGIGIIRYMNEKTFDLYFQKVQQQMIKKFEFSQTLSVKEDATHYYFFNNQTVHIKLNKTNVRNFPSKLEECTLLVGFTTKFNKKGLTDPLYLFYYDITKIKNITVKE